MQVIVLLAPSDSGAPSYDQDNAGAWPLSACPRSPAPPDAFPELMAAPIQRQDLRGVIERLKPR